MNTQETYFVRKRKPNFKKWQCPIFGTICNTRGVPSYIRNKFGLKCNPKYWDDKNKLIKDYNQKIANEKLIKIKKVLVDSRITEDVCFGIIEDCMKEFFWVLKYSYKNKGSRGLSELLQAIKDMRYTEKKKFHSRLNINNDHGTGADLFTGSQDTSISEE